MKFSLLLIRLPHTESQPVCWQLHVGSQKDELQLLETGQLDSINQLRELAEKYPQVRVITLVPGELVTLRTLNIGSKLNKTIEKSLPYRLEDDLSDDVENLHFAIFNHSDEQVVLAIVAKDRMNRWLEWLQLVGLNYQQMVPDFLALPVTAGSCSLCMNKSQWLIRKGEFTGIVCDDSWLKPYLTSLEQTESLKVIDYSPSHSSNPFSIMDPACVPVSANLLQGEFKPANSGQPRSSGLFRPLGLAVLLLLSFTGYQYTLSQKAELQAENMQQQINKLYRELYPEERVIRPVSQLKQKLQSLKTGQQQHSSFLDTLDDIAPVLHQFPGINIQSSSYDKKQARLRMVVTASTISELTDLRDQLTITRDTQLQSLDSNGQSANGVLIIN